MIKYLKYLLVPVVAVTLSGCATTRYEGTINLNTSSEKNSKAVKVNADSAIARLRAAIAQNPNNANLFYRLSILLANNKQHDEAITAAKRAIELNPGEGFDALGYAYRAKGQYDDALKAYKKAVTISPVGSNYYMLGIVYMKKQDYAHAVQALKKASELKKKNDVYLIELAIACYRMGRYDSALSVIDKAIDLKNYGTMGMKIKKEVVDDGFTKEVFFTITEIENGGPADRAGIKAGDVISGIDKINTIYYTKINLEKIKKYIEEKAPGTPVNVYIRGLFVGFPSKKTVILSRFKDPLLPLKLGIKANLLARIGKNDEAVKNATKALASKQANKNSDRVVYLALGTISVDNGKYAEAIKYFSGVKNSTTARILEATAYAKQGDLRKAINIYSTIPEEKLSSKNVPLWSDRAALLKALKPFIASTMKNIDSLKAQGHYKEALNELGNVLKISDEAKSKEILSQMSNIIKIAPGLSELPEEARKYALRGDVLTEQGKFEDAAKEYRKAVQAAPYIAKLYFNTAMIYGKLKKYSQAIRHMKIYLLLAPEAPNARAAKDQIYKWEFMMEERNKEG